MKPLSPLENTKAVSFHPTEKNFQKLCFLICFPPLHQVFLLSPNFFFLSTILLDIHTLVLLSLVFASHFAHILHLFFGLPRAGCWFRGVFDLLSFPSHCHASIHNKTIKHGLEVIPLTTRKREALGSLLDIFLLVPSVGEPLSAGLCCVLCYSLTTQRIPELFLVCKERV